MDGTHVRSDGRLLSPPFVLTASTALLFFLSFGLAVPVLPRFVGNELGQSEAIVGLVVGSTALAAIAVRPLIGRAGDRRGRKVLVLGGTLLGAAGFAGHAVAGNVPALIPMRLLVGTGMACVMVGATTLAVDLSPIARRRMQRHLEAVAPMMR